MGDAELVAAAQTGDRDALERLLKDHYDRLFAICRRLTGNDADASDATQEALISLVRGLPRFDRRSRFTTWAYRIAVNAALDELRRRRRRAEPGIEDSQLAAGDPDEPEASASRMDIDAALRGLPPDFRAPVVLRDLCGLDYAEISQVLSIPPGTVRSRIARGRAALIPLLGGNPPALADRRNEEER
jgi:RNA polymerase sigma-70 factor (ECF subfamily)